MGIVSSTGLSSGINYQELIAKTLEIEQRPIKLLEERKSSLSTISAEYTKLSTTLSSLKASSSALADIAAFNPNTLSVSKTSGGVELLTATASRTASEGLHQVTVNQLAQAHSLASQGFLDSTTTGVASSSGTFTFRVGSGGKETSVSVNSTTTLTQLRDAINNANGDAKASILNDGSATNPYRLVLTSKKTGLARDITITSNPTTLDFTNKKVEAAYAATTNSFTGTVSSNQGNNYTGTTNKTFLVKIVSAGAAGTATYKYSTDGGITFKGSNGATYDGTNAITTQGALTNYIDGNASSNSTNEGVQISFGSGTLAADDTFSIDVFNPTLVSAQDAVLEIGNLTLSRDTNTVTDAIQGLTLNLLKADSDQAIDIKVQTDTSEIKKKIKDFIAAYNTAIKFVNDQLTADPQNATPKPLLGEVNALQIKKQLQDTITALVPGASTTYNSLSRIGVTSSKTSGQLSLDESKLDSALADSVTNVTRLFAGIGVASDANVEYVSKTSATQPGIYSIAVSTAPTKATVTGGSAVPSAGITAAEILTVSVYSNATKTGDTPLAVSVSLAAGSKASDIVNAINTAFATKGIKASASKTSDGKIRVTATNYGDDYKVTIVSNQAATNQSGIGTTTLSNQGVDIAGLINGHIADGAGEVLSARTGFPEAGIKVKVPVATAGLFGTLTISSGVADRLASFLDRTTKLKGTIDTRQQGINNTLKTIDKDIQRKSRAISRLEVTLTLQFNRLETVLGQFKSQSEAVTSALTQLNNLATTISKR